MIKTWFMNRRYKSGWRWCTMRWTDVVLNGETYLRRLHLVQTPLFSVMLHWILTPDPQPDLHDHPVDFWSFVLRGGYKEEVPHPTIENPFGLVLNWWGSPRYWPWMYRCWCQFDPRPRWRKTILSSVNVKRAMDKHRITFVEPNTLTLVFAGPVVRSWGFWTARGWVGWRQYKQEV